MSGSSTDGTIHNSKIGRLASRIAESLEQGSYIQSDFELLCAQIEIEGPPDNVVAFAISLDEHAVDWFTDESLHDYAEGNHEELTDSDRLRHGRFSLNNVLSNPVESTVSVSLEKVPLEAGGALFCSALVYIKGYEPIVSWCAPHLSEEDALASLSNNGYVLSDVDVSRLPDSLILGLWKR